MLPNERIPGFMFHQIERHFNNGTGDDIGRPGDKADGMACIGHAHGMAMAYTVYVMR